MKTKEENDDPEFSESVLGDMYVSLGKNDIEKMERRFNVWLSNRDDDFQLDIWDFRCLQDFIKQEISQTRQADVEGLIAYVESINQDFEPIHEDNKQFTKGFNRAVEYIHTHLTQLKQNI